MKSQVVINASVTFISYYRTKPPLYLSVLLRFSCSNQSINQRTRLLYYQFKEQNNLSYLSRER